MVSYPEPGAVRELHSADVIARRVAELGRDITRDYAGRSPVLVSILKGSFVFAADLTRGLETGDVDLVVGNLPYVEERVVPFLPPDVRDFEPRLALAGGADGLGTYRRLFAELAALRAGAVVALEFGFGQEDAVASSALETGAFEVERTGTDLAGIVRDVVLRRRSG